MTTLREAALQALALIASARLCEVNSMSSRQEMLRLLIEATDILRAALAQEQAEQVQEPAFHGFMSADGTQVDLCFTPNAPRSDGTYATAYYTAPPQQAEPVAWMHPHKPDQIRLSPQDGWLPLVIAPPKAAEAGK